ncbi:hypothetical protein RYA05_05865 [Pseudomonas syringae pv. actinidiae]|mgnify:CR=1 FL=1|nr:hypothetical protein [Pseudomonas syringae pv. actinidiae]
MSEYQVVPPTPKNKIFSDLAQSDSLGEAIGTVQNQDKAQGLILKSGTIEDSILDGMKLGSPQAMAANVALGATKEAICTPKQIAEQKDAKRTEGIPVFQAAVLGVEAIASKIQGHDVKYEGAMKASRGIDFIAKPLVTGGGSVVADVVYEGGRTAMDISDCMDTNKKNEYAQIPPTPAETYAMIPDGGYSRPAPEAESFAAPERPTFSTGRSKAAEMSGPGM